MRAVGKLKKIGAPEGAVADRDVDARRAAESLEFQRCAVEVGSAVADEQKFQRFVGFRRGSGIGDRKRTGVCVVYAANLVDDRHRSVVKHRTLEGRVIARLEPRVRLRTERDQEAARRDRDRELRTAVAPVGVGQKLSARFDEAVVAAEDEQRRIAEAERLGGDDARRTAGVRIDDRCGRCDVNVCAVKHQCK